MSNKIISKLVSKLDNSGISVFSEKKTFDTNAVWCPTQCPELDFNLGTFGWPVGFIEIAGVSRSGKTTMGLEGMKNFQKKYPDCVCFILSSERRDNKEYAKKIGVDVNSVIIISSKFLEDLFYKFQIQLNKIKDIWREEKMQGKPKIYVMWDSIGGTLSRAEVETFQENTKIVEKNIEKGTDTKLNHAQMGAFAKNAKMMVKAIIGQIYEMEMVFVALNHTGVDFQTGQRKSTGGEWKDYMPNLRLQVSLKEHIKIDDEEVGQITKVKVVKNDFGSRRVTEIEILLGYGVVLSDGDIQYAIKKGILKQEGAKKVSYMNGKLSWSTKRQFYQLYMDNNKLLKVLQQQITKARHNDVIKSKEVDDDEE